MSGSGFMKDTVILFAITLVSGLLLDGVYQLTKEPIELVTIAANNKAYKAVFAETETFDSGKALIAAVPACNETLVDMNFGGVEMENVLKAVDAGDSQLGYVITSLPNDSYGGVVKLLVGLKDDGIITSIELLGINDTPGLGLKTKEPTFKDQHAGKNAPELSVTKSGSADDTQINVISGVTITSNATTNVANAALYYLHNCIQ